jgi:hypothetical protein
MKTVFSSEEQLPLKEEDRGDIFRCVLEHEKQ